MFAQAPMPPPEGVTQIQTNISFTYNDLGIKNFTGVANIVAYDNILIYTGEIDKGVCKGRGLLYNRLGKLIYDGQFDQNKYNGYGKHYNSNGRLIYEGEFYDNLYSGEGKHFSATGSLIYDGSFKVGLYDGDGKQYAEAGWLSYEGRFVSGARSGEGKSFFLDGTSEYVGAFMSNQFHGDGVLYNQSGQLIYTGTMANGKINYRSYINASLNEVEAAFGTQPTIYYTDNNEACFFYERVGAAITVDCKVKINEWQREGQDLEETEYYIPQSHNFASSSSKLTIGSFLSTSTSTPSSSSSQPSFSSSSSSIETEEDVSSSTEEPKSSLPDLPDFIAKTKEMYFEVDKDVWSSEKDLDKSKVTVKRVSVIGDYVMESGATELDDTQPISVEECTLIEYLRRQDPTIFSDVAYTVNKNNKLFREVSGINNAATVTRKAYYVNGYVFRYCYEANSQTPAYIMIEK